MPSMSAPPVKILFTYWQEKGDEMEKAHREYATSLLRSAALLRMKLLHGSSIPSLGKAKILLQPFLPLGKIVASRVRLLVSRERAPILFRSSEGRLLLACEECSDITTSLALSQFAKTVFRLAPRCSTSEARAELCPLPTATDKRRRASLPALPYYLPLIPALTTPSRHITTQ